MALYYGTWKMDLPQVAYAILWPAVFPVVSDLRYLSKVSMADMIAVYDGHVCADLYILIRTIPNVKLDQL